MASAPTWGENDIEFEQNNPVPAYTKCTAKKDFKGEFSHDLPFSKGEQLTVLEPCNRLFWYLAENEQGRRGVIPITYVKVHTLHTRPPPYHPPTSHPTSHPPTSHPPTSHPPTSHPPTSHPPTSHPPTSHPPTSHPPTSHPPTSHPPTSHPPTSHPPTYPPPSSHHSPKATHAPPTPSPLTDAPPPLPPKPKDDATPPLPPPKPLKPQSKTFPRPTPSAHGHTPVSRSTSNEPVSAPRQSSHHSHLSSSYPPPDLPPIDIDSRPPAPLPKEALRSNRRIDAPEIFREPGKYRTMMEFCEKSGWFTPSVEGVLVRKMGMQLTAFQSTKCGVYIFVHKTDPRKKYVGQSRNLSQDMIHLFHRLFEKPEKKLSPLEVELKYHSPDAPDWYVRASIISNPEALDLETSKKIVQYRTLQPEGLNTELHFFSKEDWYAFAEWYSQHRRDKANRPF